MKTIGQVIDGLWDRAGLPDLMREKATGRIWEWEDKARGWCWMGYVRPPFMMREHLAEFEPVRVAVQEALAI